MPIDSVEDMALLLDGIDLGAVSTSMTINATAAILLCLYQAVGRRQGTDASRLRGTVQNDILKEYIARGTYIFPPEPSMRLVTDTFAYCRTELPAWNTISISGYHMREAGSTPPRRWPSPSPTRSPMPMRRWLPGLAFEEFAPRLSFFFAAHNDLFEEVAKFRVARRAWARVARDRFGATSRESQAMRFHVQTGGSTLTAQQPDTNVVRTTVQGLAAVLGGAQSLHTNALDEALGLPSPSTARLALRTQQVLAYESGVTGPVDPLGGSYYVESLTDALDERVTRRAGRDRRRGGTLAALADGYQQGEIAQAAYEFQRAVEAGETIVVGVNAFAEGGDEQRPAPQQIDPEAEARQVARTQAVRAGRDQAAARCRRGRPDRRGDRDGERTAAHPGLRGGPRDAGRDQRRAARRLGGASAMTIGAIHHVAVVVRSIDDALPRYERLFGWRPERDPFDFPQQGVRLCFLPTGTGRPRASSWWSPSIRRAASPASWRNAAKVCTMSAW